jgi:hypothetical protein
MTDTRILCTTPLDPLLTPPGGVALHDRQAQLRAVVRRRLGDKHADLLAEPLRRDADRLDWLSPVGGLVRPLAALPAAVRDSVRAECHTLLADIDHLGRALESGATGNARLAGQLLRLAARQPADDRLFLVGNHPVVAGWGVSRADAGPALSPPPKAAAPRTGDPAAPCLAPRWLTAAPQCAPPAARVAAPIVRERA